MYVDCVESLEGCRVDGTLFIHVLFGQAVQGLGDEGKVLDVVAKEIAQPNESPYFLLAGLRRHVLQDGKFFLAGRMPSVVSTNPK